MAILLNHPPPEKQHNAGIPPFETAQRMGCFFVVERIISTSRDIL